MNAYEIKRALADVPDDAEVFLATQPAYPMQYNVGQVVVTSPGDLELIREEGLWSIVNNHCDPQDDEYWVDTDLSLEAAEKRLQEIKDEHVPKVFIVEGDTQNYLRGDDCRAVGW